MNTKKEGKKYIWIQTKVYNFTTIQVDTTANRHRETATSGLQGNIPKRDTQIKIILVKNDLCPLVWSLQRRQALPEFFETQFLTFFALLKFSQQNHNLQQYFTFLALFAMFQMIFEHPQKIFRFLFPQSGESKV